MAGLENRIPPPVVTLAIGGAMAALAGFGPSLAVAPAVRWGLVIVVAGIAGSFGFPAFRAFARAGTTINPVAIETASSLVTTGPFARSRNPMYVGLALLLTALALALDAGWTFAGPLFFVAFITRFQIVPEERAMSARFGSDYAAYRSRVRRWL